MPFDGKYSFGGAHRWRLTPGRDTRGCWAPALHLERVAAITHSNNRFEVSTGIDRGEGC